MSIFIHASIHLQLVPRVVKHVQPWSHATHATQDTRKLPMDQTKNAKVSKYLSFFTMSISDRSTGELLLSSFEGIEYLLRYIDSDKSCSSEITIMCKF